MKSTGNDIVALALVDKQRTIQPGFYSKILSIAEQELYPKTGYFPLPFYLYVWLLWSVKESAYKFFKRDEPALVFSPARIVVQNLEFPLTPVRTSAETTQWEGNGKEDELYTGRVMFADRILYFQSKVAENWIATVVNEGDSFMNVYWGVRSIEDASHERQSGEARTFLLNRLNLFIPGDLQLAKSPAGYPILLKDGQDLNVAASLAHHDRFVAFSFIAEAVDAGQLA